MTWSCERDACGSARPEADAVWPFAAHRSGETESRPVRQGISSTDKDVTDSLLKAMMAGGFSSSPRLAGTATFDLVNSLTSRDPSPVCAGALVDGRYGQGLDSGVVSVKLPARRRKVPPVRRFRLAGFRKDSGANGSPPYSGGVAAMVM
jgi:hypothetical protein